MLVVAENETLSCNKALEIWAASQIILPLYEAGELIHEPLEVRRLGKVGDSVLFNEMPFVGAVCSHKQNED